MQTKGMGLSEEGARRISNAVFATAYNDKDLIDRATENGTDPGIRNALLGAAASWANMRNTAPGFDVTPDLVKAIGVVNAARGKNMNLAQFLAQADAFDQVPERVQSLAKLFYNANGTRLAAWRDVRDRLRSYADAGSNTSNADGDMFGAKADPDEALAGIVQSIARKPEEPAQAAPGPELFPTGQTLSKPPMGRGKGGAPSGRKIAASPQMEDMEDAAPGDMGDDRKPQGTLAPQTEDVSMSSGRSPYEEAYRAAGLDPDEGVNLPPEQRVSTLRRVMVQTFGFRSFETAGVGIKDAVNQMLNAFRNVRFMMHALGLPVKGVSLNGTLAITLETGSKRYFGVYRPGSRTIGMPGRSNSFAHEWMHALDHYLMDALKGRGDALLSQWTRNKGLDPNVSLENAFINLIHRMFFDEAGLALKTLELERAAAAVVEKGPNAGQPTAAAKLAQEQLTRLKSGATRINLPKTDYRQAAQDYDPGSPYWSSVHEMLARAFEAYVAYKVEALGGTNEFITKGDAAYLSDADRRLAMTFPKADDRMNIFAAFDDVLHHIRNGAILGTDPAAARPADTDIVDPQHYNKLVLAQGNPRLIDSLKKEAFAARNAIQNFIKNGPVQSLRDGVSQWALNAGINPNMTLKNAGAIALDLTRTFLFSIRGAIRPRIARNKGKGAGFMQDAFDDFATIAGAGTEQARTYEEERAQEAIKDVNQIEAALRANGKSNLRLTKDENETTRKILFGEKVPGADPALVKIAAALRRLMDDIHTRAERAGINIGYVREKGYLPRVLNPSAVRTNPRGFEKAATELYRLVFDNTVSDPDFTDADLLGLSRETDHRQGNATGTSRYAALDTALRRAMRAVDKAKAGLDGLPLRVLLERPRRDGHAHRAQLQPCPRRRAGQAGGWYHGGASRRQELRRRLRHPVGGAVPDRYRPRGDLQQRAVREAPGGRRPVRVAGRARRVPDRYPWPGRHRGKLDQRAQV